MTQKRSRSGTPQTVILEFPQPRYDTKVKVRRLYDTQLCKKKILKVHKVNLVQIRLHRSGFAKSIQWHGDSSKNSRKKGFSMNMRARDKTDAQRSDHALRGFRSWQKYRITGLQNIKSTFCLDKPSTKPARRNSLKNRGLRKLRTTQ